MSTEETASNDGYEPVRGPRPALRGSDSGHDDGLEGGEAGIVMKDLQPVSSTESVINGDSTGI